MIIQSSMPSTVFRRYVHKKTKDNLSRKAHVSHTSEPTSRNTLDRNTPKLISKENEPTHTHKRSPPERQVCMPQIHVYIEAHALNPSCDGNAPTNTNTHIHTRINTHIHTRLTEGNDLRMMCAIPIQKDIWCAQSNLQRHTFNQMY